MKDQITRTDLIRAAGEVGLSIVHDGGYRIVEEHDGGHYRNIFPKDGELSESKRACAGFLLGVKWQRGVKNFSTAYPSSN